MNRLGPGGGAIEQRLERLDALHQIRQLAVRYAAAMRAHDREALGLLFVDDVRVADGRTGRHALRVEYFGSAMEGIDIAVLHIGTHVVALDRERLERASGSVYATAQFRERGRWVRQAICYFDRYAKRNDEWFFLTREHQLFYGANYNQRPNKLPPANWPVSDTGTGTLPFSWDTWEHWKRGDRLRRS
jgi:SnoaL-like domain